MKDTFQRYLTEIEKELQRAFPAPDELSRHVTKNWYGAKGRESSSPGEGLIPFYGMMRYHLGWADERFQAIGAERGKRLRPLLCLLACEAVGGEYQLALPAAAAIELVHNFSLIHDDIEDRDHLRHHRPTVWHLWGEPQAINVGDGMFVLAHLTLHRLLDRGTPPSRMSAVVKALDAACLSLCQGQYLDLSFEERLDVTVEEYLAMVEGKTAALIACATKVGAMLATNDEALIERYRSFGECLGFAFQMVDDILGIWGDPKTTGKPAASDIACKKKTMPIVYALGLEAKSKALREIYGKEALSKEDVQRVLAILDELGARDYAQRIAEGYRDRALVELEKTGIENEAQEGLRELARFLTERVY